MDNIFADRYRLFDELNSRATKTDEQAKKQHDKVNRSFGKDGYNPWHDLDDIIPKGKHQAPSTRKADAVGYDILFNLDEKLSIDDLKNEKNIVDPPKKERCTYQWGKPYEYKSAKHVNSGSICSDDACALQLNWERRAMEFKSQEKDALASDSYSTVNKRKTTHVSTDRKGKKRKANDYPQWGFQDAKGETVCEKKQRKANKHDAREHKRKVNSKEHVGGSCQQCERKDLMKMLDDEIFTDSCYWLPS